MTEIRSCQSDQIRQVFGMISLESSGSDCTMGSGLRETDVNSDFASAATSRGSPKYLSSDNAPLFLYHEWQASLRIPGADEIKSIPYTPLSHPFVERLIGSIRLEYLDQMLFWNASDL